MFQFTDKVTEENRKEIIKKMKDSVSNMNGKIPGLLRAELGENLSGGPHDIVLYSEFERIEDIPAYRNHPLHVVHQKMTKNWVCNRVWADYMVEKIGE